MNGGDAIVAKDLSLVGPIKLKASFARWSGTTPTPVRFEALALLHDGDAAGMVGVGREPRPQIDERFVAGSVQGRMSRSMVEIGFGMCSPSIYNR